MNNILQQIVKDINEEKVKSVQPQALTKRGGEYRIGLSKAIDIVEEYAAQFAAPPPASEGEMRQRVTEIIYKNSTDDSECLRIPFEKIHDVIGKIAALATPSIPTQSITN